MAYLNYFIKIVLSQLDNDKINKIKGNYHLKKYIYIYTFVYAS